MTQILGQPCEFQVNGRAQETASVFVVEVTAGSPIPGGAPGKSKFMVGSRVSYTIVESFSELQERLTRDAPSTRKINSTVTDPRFC